MVPTYATLQTDILAWLRRETNTPSPNINDQMEQITRMGEHMLYYGSVADQVEGLRSPLMFGVTRVNVGTNVTFIQLPDDILEVNEVLFINHPNAGVAATYGHIDTPFAVQELGNESLGWTTRHVYYAVQGNRIEFGVGVGSDFDCDIMGYKREPYLDVDPTAHATFVEHYAIWLAAGCWSACVYLRMVEFAEYWRQTMAEMIRNVNNTQIRRVGLIYAGKGVKPPHFDSQAKLQQSMQGGGQ